MTATSFNQSSNLIIGDDAAELLRLGSVGIVAGFGGNDTIEGPINGVAPGSTLFGGMGNDFLTTRGVGDFAFGGMGNDVLVNESGRATQYGEAGNDTILGEEDQNTVYGGAGNDSIYVAEDRNVVFGGDGNDTIRGGEGNDIFAGGAGNDYLIAAQTSDAPTFLFGNEGNDILVAGPNSDSLYGGMGNDSVYAGTASNANNMFLSGDKGGDTITYLGSGASVILDGDRSASLTSAGTDAGADVFIVGAGATNLDVFGGAGNDSLFGTSGAIGAGAEVFLGQGNDYFVATSGGNSSFSGDLGDDFGSIVASSNDTILGDPAVIGTDASAGNDTLLVTPTGTTSATVIYGDDTASGAAGNDSLVLGAGAGSALVIGGAGNDYLDGSLNPQADTLVGGEGNDIYRFGADDVIPFDSLGNNTYIAGATAMAKDTITVTANDSFTGGATFFVTGEAELIKTIDNGGVIASNEKDLITITGTANGLTSLAGGDDTLNANNLATTGSVFGGAGNDRITFSGTDIAAGAVDGGAGNDLIAFTNPAAVVRASVAGGAGDDTIASAGVFSGSASGGDGVDVFNIATLSGDADGASISAGAGDESIIIGKIGTGGAISVSGDAGNDTLSVGTASFLGTVATPLTVDGGEGNDLLRVGSTGNATLIGGAGNDTLISSIGQGYAGTAGSTAVQQGDSLVGGAGNDVFGFAGTGKLGFIGTATANYGTATGPSGNIVDTNNDGSGFFNNVAVDTIAGFTSGQDILFFGTSFINATGTVAASSFALIQPAGTTGLGNAQVVSGSNVTSGVGAPNILGAVGTGNGIFVSGTAFAAPATFGSNANMFTYDQGAGALYFAPAAREHQLVAIFPDRPTLATTDFVFGNFSTIGSSTILI